MLRNLLHSRLEKLANCQNWVFIACLCERMYPNYQLFCQQTQFGDEKLYRSILDLLWEALLVKDAKINFDSQLEKLAEVIPVAGQFDLYGVYPAIDACAALSEALHARLSGEVIEHTIAVSEISLHTVAALVMTESEREMNEAELGALPIIQDELDLQWQIFSLLVESEVPDLELIRELRAELREAGVSNIGINLRQ